MVIPRPDTEQPREPFRPLVIWNFGQEFRINEEDRASIFRRKRRDVAGGGNAGLIAEPVARREEDEGNNDTDHHVILPTRSGVVPKNKALKHLQITILSRLEL